MFLNTRFSIKKPKFKHRLGCLLTTIFIALIYTDMSSANTTLARNSRPISTPQPTPTKNIKPFGLTIKNRFDYDGDSDDLATAGLGFSLLKNSTPTISIKDPANPTLKELRQLRLGRYINQNSGEGTFFGFRNNELTPLFDGKFAGYEVLAFQDDGENGDSVAMLLQVPLDFNERAACIVVVPASDSNSIYDAKDVQIRGLWGLRHNCAVVYTDKGLGNGLFDLTNNQGSLITGITSYASVAGDKLQFVPNMANQRLFAQKNPNRFALKQLHSKQNPEGKAGQYVIDAINFAFYQLNNDFTPSESEPILTKKNTLVLVYGSNDGGAAAIKAGEMDIEGLIDGIVAVNPTIQPENTTLLFMNYKGKETELTPKSLIDYSTYGQLYMSCAIYAIKPINDINYPFSERILQSPMRCASLKDKGLLTADTLDAQAEEALQKLYAYGWEPTMNSQFAFQQHSQYTSFPYRYISALGEYGVDEPFCNYGVASIDQNDRNNKGEIAPLLPNQFNYLWSKNNGQLPQTYNYNNVIDLINLADPNGPRRELYSTSASTGRIDYNIDGAICLRNLATNPRNTKIKNNLEQVKANGDLNKIPTIIVHARDNPAVLADHSSRAYVALNSRQEGANNKVRYIEVTNSSYFDANPPFDHLLVPIDYYGESAITHLWNHLNKGASLPDSQVIHTVPRGGLSGMANRIQQSNIPVIALTPRNANLITTKDGKITIPN